MTRPTFTHDRQMTRYPFGRKTEHRRRFDQQAVDYFKRVEALGTSISVDERTNISSFIRGLKALGAWESLVDGWLCPSTQNVGTGSVVVGLKALNGTLLNGPTWGVNGITSVGAASEIRVAANFNPSGLASASWMTCYSGLLDTNTVGMGADDTVASIWFNVVHNWATQGQSGCAVFNNAGPWVSGGLFMPAAYVTGFQTNQFDLVPGVSMVGRNQGVVAWPSIYSNPLGTFANTPGLSFRMQAQRAGHVWNFFGIWNKAVTTNLHPLFRDTVGKGLSLP